MTLFDETTETPLRTRLAASCLAGIIASYANPAFEAPTPGMLMVDEARAAARDAVTYADALIARLAATEGGDG